MNINNITMETRKADSYIFNKICPCEIRRNGFAISGMFFQALEVEMQDHNQFSLN